MADDIDPIRQGFGQRLAAARELKGLTQAEVGDRFGVGKGTVSAWETGRGDPGVFRLMQLAKLYGVSSDALLWASAPSLEGMQFAAQYDSLSEGKKRALEAFWMAYIAEAAPGGEKLPPAPTPPPFGVITAAPTQRPGSEVSIQNKPSSGRGKKSA